ncbi:amidohydrolase/deacetylase family metallohydrolase [Abyssisolibacter fermentans]|uniref:amidohydrolase/deacetylase family metallohydrolase n=1 Tax=Abyssisolibacter fermentans TaxID=1766203 RepID=UPI00082D8974|nr:amidohydrolase/deacetylase family metallohydrolase [Abyssisolibacter fermentans]
MCTYDVILKGGKIIDHKINLYGDYDILIHNGYIHEIGKSIITEKTTRIIDVSGMYIIPGLIDMHTHVYPDETSLGINADDIGVNMGISTVVDAGSAGALNFEKFRDDVIKNSKTNVYSFLNISKYGLKHGGELTDLNNIDLNLNKKVINDNRAYIKGIKVRASKSVVGKLGIKPIMIAKKFAKEMKLPLMVHIGNEPPKIIDVLNILDKGDIVTHIYHGKPGGMFDCNGKVLKEVEEAYKRGVIFDVGHGTASFNFNIAKAAIKLGLKPRTISTDIHARNFNSPVKSLLITMSKFLVLGLSVEEILECVSRNASKILDVDNHIFKGNIADIAVLELKNNTIEVEDSDQNKMNILEHFIIKYAINKNNIKQF